MTARRDIDHLIATWLTEIAPEGHVDYLDATLDAIGEIGQRPPWTSVGRWLPMQLPLGRVVLPRVAPYLAVLTLVLILAIAAVVITGGRNRLPAPFGLAETGLVAYVSDGDIFVTTADGLGRRRLVSGPGAEWSPIWSHRGDRIAYWAAPALGDPASLWLADRDGSTANLLTGTQTFVVPDQLPAVSWSPDDRRLAFTSDEGVLYLVGADGRDLHPIGDDSHERHDAVWSPDGTLLAYRGRPHADRYTTMSSWVITPDGRTDIEVIAAKGGQEITNVNPSWSPDGTSFLVHTGMFDIDISEGRRDATGAWSDRVLIGGPTQDFHPSWSNAGTKFSYIELVPGTNPEEFVLMTANADGSNAKQVSTVRVGFAAQCWSPDDRSIRAVGPSRIDPAILLIPVDGSPVVEIPEPGQVSRGACAMQRVAH